MKIIMQNTVSIWKLYSIACWDDDKYQKASAKHEKIAHRFISLRLFFPPYLCPPFSHILCWINIILKSILPLHSSTEGKKSFANIYNILSHSQHNFIVNIFFLKMQTSFFYAFSLVLLLLFAIHFESFSARTVYLALVRLLKHLWNIWPNNFCLDSSSFAVELWTEPTKK